MSSPENGGQNGAEFEPNQELETVPVGYVLKGITFSEEIVGGNPVFRSDSPDRKVLFLDSASPKPEPGSVYKVKIIKDTEPDDPSKGKLFGIIVKERTDLTEDDWKKIDQNVNDLELVNR